MVHGDKLPGSCRYGKIFECYRGKKRNVAIGVSSDALPDCDRAAVRSLRGNDLGVFIQISMIGMRRLLTARRNKTCGRSHVGSP